MYPADSLIAKIIGPLATASSVKALGGDYATFMNNWYSKEPVHYANAIRVPSNYWAEANYYDRVKSYYGWHIADPDRADEYFNKGNELALNYRDLYAPTGNVSGHWSMPVGVALHHLLTNDPASRTWVLNVGNTFTAPYYKDNLDNSNGEMDNRMQARCLEAWSLCWALTGDAKWATLLRNGLTDILTTQDADGAYRLHNTEQDGENKPFMVGLLNDAMILYGRLFERDSRIADSIQRACSYMWSNNWVASAGAFIYQEGDDPDEPPSADLNNLILNGFTFSNMVSEAKEIFAGSLNAWIDGQKQFNQTYLQPYQSIANVDGVDYAWEGAVPPQPEPGPEPDVDIETAKAALIEAQSALASATAYVDTALAALGGDTVRRQRDRKFSPSSKGG